MAGGGDEGDEGGGIIWGSLKRLEVFSHRQKRSSLRERGGKTGDFYCLFWKSGGCREEQLAWTKRRFVSLCHLTPKSTCCSINCSLTTADFIKPTARARRRKVTRFLPTNKQEASDTARLSERRRAETGRDWINESLTSKLWWETNSQTNQNTFKTEMCSILKGQFPPKKENSFVIWNLDDYQTFFGTNPSWNQNFSHEINNPLNQEL